LVNGGREALGVENFSPVPENGKLERDFIIAPELFFGCFYRYKNSGKYLIFGLLILRLTFTPIFFIFMYNFFQVHGHYALCHCK
jgi:hypothetical protein